MKHEVSTTKQQPESSGMEIPDYAIERLAKCLLPLMRRHFENMDRSNLSPDASCTECVA